MSIIEVNNLSKRYQIGSQREDVTSRDLHKDLVNAVKKPFRFLSGKRKNKNFIWALKDITFSVEPGEILGIIGPNGAGKTTLLKVLTRITPPTQGNAVIRGSVASLLETGTGFHQELTGRENIYLNGAILGMKGKEIDRKFDKIAKFAGVEKFLNTPLKRYSAGMEVRLAFSVAAHLESDILLVDEVLAVGDVDFQRKSLNSMRKATQESGRTILFISHNMGAIKSICQKCILLSQGEIKKIGESEKIIDEYLKEGVEVKKEERKLDENREINIREVSIVNQDDKKTNQINMGENFKIKMRYEVNKDVNNSAVLAQIMSSNDNKSLIYSADVDIHKNLLQMRKRGGYQATIEVNDLLLTPDTYNIKVMAIMPGRMVYDTIQAPLRIVEAKKLDEINLKFRYGSIISKFKWTIDKI